MKSDAKTIISIIDSEKNELINKKDEAIKNQDNETVNMLFYQIQLLEYIINKLYKIYEFTDESAILEILRQNYGKHNTELVALNGDKYLINKDEPVGIQENLLFWPENIEDPTTISPIDKAINLDTIIEINTIKED